LGGVSLIGVGALISVASHTTTSTNSINQFFGVISAAIGSVLLVIGIGYLAMSYGLLKGRGWAWTTTIILMFIGIAIQIISTTSGTVLNASLLSNSSSNNVNTVNSGIIGGIIGIAINVAIVYYLYRPNVKAYFGKAHPLEIK